MAKWKTSSVVVVVIAAACSRSASNRQSPEPDLVPVPERSVTTSDESAALASMEAAIRGQDPSIAVVTTSTVERQGQTLTQYRIVSPSTRLPGGIGSPTLVMYTPVEERSGSSAALDAMLDAHKKAVELIPGLMTHGQIAVEPVVAYFAVKPGRKARAWVSGLVQPLLIQDRDRLLHELGAVEVPEIKRPIVVGIVFPADGQSVNAFDLPMPPDWVAAMAQAAPRPLIFPEELFAIVWPD